MKNDVAFKSKITHIRSACIFFCGGGERMGGRRDMYHIFLSISAINSGKPQDTSKTVLILIPY